MADDLDQELRELLEGYVNDTGDITFYDPIDEHWTDDWSGIVPAPRRWSNRVKGCLSALVIALAIWGLAGVLVWCIIMIIEKMVTW
jgi:hypothetical protein